MDSIDNLSACNDSPSSSAGGSATNSSSNSTTSEFPKALKEDQTSWERFMSNAGITAPNLRKEYSEKLLAVDIDFSLVSELSRDPSEASNLLTAAGITCVGHQMKIIKWAKKLGESTLTSDTPMNDDDGHLLPTIPRQNHTVLPASSSLISLPSSEQQERKLNALSAHVRSPSEMLFLLSSNPDHIPDPLYNPSALPSYPFSLFPYFKQNTTSSNPETDAKSNQKYNHADTQLPLSSQDSSSPAAAADCRDSATASTTTTTVTNAATNTHTSTRPTAHDVRGQSAIRPQFQLLRSGADWRQHGLWKMMGI
mmetsp:Transcript_5955/g.9204  ORF Transcript_5955/g.9204 Transcript_5955/m.9204 type:complete len:310 (-) Transcript_5955:323-1252(-)